MDANNLTTNDTRRRRSLLRILADVVSHPAMASYWPAGPGSLSLGQGAAVGRRGPYIHRDARVRPGRHDPVRPACADLSMNAAD